MYNSCGLGEPLNSLFINVFVELLLLASGKRKWQKGLQNNQSNYIWFKRNHCDQCYGDYKQEFIKL